MPDENDYRPGDSEVPILRKILNRLGELVGFGPPGDVTIGPVTLTASDIEIGAVELKDGTTDTRAKIRTDDPDPGDEGLVVRNIPSGTQDVAVTNFPATQPVSAVSLPLPTGAATEATLATRLSESEFEARINTLGQKTMVNSTPVVIASDQSTLPVSAASLPLPSGAATEATLSTRLSEAEFQARINTLGQKTGANSTPVVIASDQTLACPIGAATETTLLEKLTTVAFQARINVQGQNLMANSTPVVIASDQSAVEVQAQSWPLPTGAATDAAFQARINTQGQKTMAASTPVVIASDQSSLAAVLKPATSGGLTTFHLVSAGTTNATSVKGSAGQLYGWFIYNSNTSARKVAFHNTAGTPTAGASIFFSLVIPPSSGANVFSDIGIAFSSGIGITTVTGIADSDSAAVAANDLVINLFYS